MQLKDGRRSLGSGRVAVAGGTTATVRLVLGPRARDLLRKRARDRVTLVVTLAGGGRQQVEVTLTR